MHPENKTSNTAHTVRKDRNNTASGQQHNRDSERRIIKKILIFIS